MNLQIYMKLVSEVDQQKLEENLVRRFPNADVCLDRKGYLYDKVKVIPHDDLTHEEAVWILQKTILDSN